MAVHSVRMLLIIALHISAPMAARDVAAEPWAFSAHRRLLASACGDECKNCTNAGTGVGAVCRACHNNLVVLRNLPVDDPSYMACGCPAGRYLDGSGSAARCRDCARGFYCPGARSAAEACPNGMDTLAPAAKKIGACLEKPGYAYVPAAVGSGPAAVPCPANSFNAGYKRAQCRRCTPGFVIEDNAAVRTSPDLCVTPPGWFVNQADAAARCPKGEFKPGFNLAKACSKCPKGVTTERTGSSSQGQCNTLKPGFTGSLASLELGVNPSSVKPCPQSHFCRLTTLASTEVAAAQPCPSGLWTRDMGAASEAECMVPPGHWLDAAASATRKCSDSAYRAGWLRPTDPAALSCSPCGEGISADPSQLALPVYDAATGAVASFEYVAGSEEACFVEAGWGVYMSEDGSFRGLPCNASNVYGAPARLYGLLTTPCRLCPQDMQTTLATFSGLANSPDACLNQPGFGYQNRMSEPCRKGTYNPGGNRDPCHECGTGLTTKTSMADDSGAISQAQCVAEPGFQVVNGEASECEQGTYNDGAFSNCTACSPGFTTESTGASSCDLCLPGHCGADCAAATSGFFSPGGPAVDSACIACPASTDFVLQFPGMAEGDLVYTAPTISAAASPSRSHCVAAFAQLSNGAPLEAASGVAVPPGVSSLDGCVTACSSAACQFLSFDYGSRTCSIRTGTPGKNAADNLFYVLAFKQVNAGSAGANSIANAASPGSGFFTFYEDSTAKDVAGLAAVPEGTTTQQQCLAACTMDEACAVVLITQSGDAVRSFVSCGLIRPLAVPNGQVRSLIRADPAKASLESLTAGAGGAAGGGQQAAGPWVSPVGRCPSVVSTIVGGATQGLAGGDGGPATAAKLVDPASLVYDSRGNLFILDREASQVRRVDAATGIISTLAVTYPPHGYSLYGPRKMDIDSNDNLYIAANQHSSIVKIAPNGSTSLAAGTGSPGYNGDGILATSAQLNYPDAVAVDAEGNLYISDSGNSRIRRVDAKTGIITTIAGNGASCNAVPTTGAAVPALTTCIGWTWALGVSPDGKTVWFDLKNNYLFQLRDGVISAINYVGGEIPHLRPDPAGKLHYTVFNSRCVTRYDGGSNFTRVAGFCNEPAPDADGKDALDTHFLGYRMSLLWHGNTLLIGEMDWPWGVGVARVRKVTYNC